MGKISFGNKEIKIMIDESEAAKTLGKVVYSKFGVFTPDNRYNFDQVPMPFCCMQDDTLDEVGAQQVIIHGPGNSEKSFCTLQLFVRAAGSQPKPCIIFRGKGNRFEAERELYDNRVHVLFQPNAWVDRDTCMEWDRVVFREHIVAR